MNLPVFRHSQTNINQFRFLSDSNNFYLMKRILISFFVCLSIVYRVFTPIRYFYTGGIALSMLVPLLLLYTLGGLYRSVNFNITIVISLIPVLLSFCGIEYFIGYLPDSITLLFTIGCFEYYIWTKDDKFAKYSLLAMYLSLFVLTIISTPILIAEPGLNRAVNTMEEQGMEIPIGAYFTISYGMVHAVPILVIPLFYLYKRLQSFCFKIIVAVFIATLFITTILSNASTPMFMLFMFVIFVLLYNPLKSNRINTIRIGGACFILLIFYYLGLFTFILREGQSLLGGTMQERRIDEVISFMETGETSGDISKREDKYTLSLNTFLSHPFSWEENINKIGNHSYLLDHLTAMGLIAFIPFALLLVYRYKRPLKYLGRGKFNYVLAYSAFIILACMKNFFCVESAMFICPALIIYIRRNFVDSGVYKP